jgi:hypothetical protein
MDNSTPATKADVKTIMEEFGRLYVAMAKWKEELKEHFDLTAENIRYDLIGTHKDKISVIDDRTIDHEKRISHLETHSRF